MCFHRLYLLIIHLIAFCVSDISSLNLNNMDNTEAIGIKCLKRSQMSNRFNSSINIDRFLDTLIRQHKQSILINIFYVIVFVLLFLFILRTSMKFIQKSLPTASLYGKKSFCFLVSFSYLIFF